MSKINGTRFAETTRKKESMRAVNFGGQIGGSEEVRAVACRERLVEAARKERVPGDADQFTGRFISRGTSRRCLSFFCIGRDPPLEGERISIFSSLSELLNLPRENLWVLRFLRPR